MKNRLFPLMSLLLIIGVTGCNGMKNSMRTSEKSSAWNPLHQMSKDKKEQQDDEEARPVTMAAIWADSVYEKPGEPTVKGFGGRVFFYDENNQPVKADGELIVYGFDDSGADKTDTVADRKFVFKADKFQSHFSENELGASYSVWVPWEKFGGYRKSITLIPMFRTTEGSLIKCSQAICTLPGKRLKDEQFAESDEKPYKVLGSSPAVVSQANYQSGTPVQTSGEGVANTGYQGETQVINRIKTSTILLNPSMSRRMAQSTPNRGRGEKAATERQSVQHSAAAADSMTVQKTEFVAQSEATKSRANPNRSNQQPKSTPRNSSFGQPGPWGK